jgi:hypothetical protein
MNEQREENFTEQVRINIDKNMQNSIAADTNM